MQFDSAASCDFSAVDQRARGVERLRVGSFDVCCIVVADDPI